MTHFSLYATLRSLTGILGTARSTHATLETSPGRQEGFGYTHELRWLAFKSEREIFIIMSRYNTLIEDAKARGSDLSSITLP